MKKLKMLEKLTTFPEITQWIDSRLSLWTQAPWLEALGLIHNTMLPPKYFLKLFQNG